MSANARLNTITETISRESRNVQYPQKNGKPQWISEIFGQNVFSLNEMSKRLPKPIYSTFLKQIRGNEIIDKTTADAIAHAVKVWAMEHGATHFTHWFQPQTDSTAEKHDSFLTLKSTFRGGYEETTALDTFSGSQLLQSEPDASSFPSGGMRSTFEARGYTVWDTKSPMFLQEGPHDTAILYIPSVFISYNGEALDEKTVLLRSSEVLAKTTLELLDLLGPVDEGMSLSYHFSYAFHFFSNFRIFIDETRVKHVHTTLGTEQEYFLIDRGLYSLRPDLKITGRTLFGGLPPRHQQLEDHYFGKIPTRILAAMSECEMELYKLGVPVKTRHNEVAPAQFELAPIFEEAMIAVDHNLLTMDVLHRVAHRHKLKVLFHEKPFKGVNGSGKHCNWSMSTDTGENLLEPTAHPETNYRFLLFLVAILKALADHGGLLRAGIASASNEHRLGAHEAPPGIISAFLGDHLNDVLDSIEEGRPLKKFGSSQFHSVRVGGTVLDLKVATLPNIARDLTDRNRTSPFAFTGNKFEFRAVGSKQSVSFPMTLLNSAVASSLQFINADLKKQMGDKKFASTDDQLAVIKKYIKETKKVRFEGDNYSEAWAQEAKKRGLPNISNCPDAFAQLQDKKNSEMLNKLGVFSAGELNSRYHILMEKYAKDIQIEAETLRTMVVQHILPSTFTYRRELAETASLLKSAGSDSSPEANALNALSPIVAELQKAAAKLEEAVDEFINIQDIDELGKAAHDSLFVRMEETRSHADKLERLVADKHWPFPKYAELFLNI